MNYMTTVPGLLQSLV